MDELVSLTRDLVAIPSHEDETAVGDFIEDWLREQTNADVTRDDAGNVVARKGDPNAESLALVGHHDVVPPDDSQVRDDGGYVVEERDGRLYGRGTADMKGAVAAMMLAFRDGVARSATEAESRPQVGDAGSGGELVFASFVGEEIGGEGARHAIGEGFAPEYAVVGEGSTNYSAPGVTDVAVAHKGRRASTVTARGTAAHASVPAEGENAVYRACDAVDVIRDLAFPAVEVMGRSVRGSVAVTGVEGGSAWNVIPEHCEVTVDERTVPGERAALEGVEEIEGVEWTIDQDLPPMRCGDAAFADGVLDAARAVQAGADATPEHVVKPHATDAGWLADAGTDCVIFGPAEPGEAHTASESASVAVLARCRRIYERIATDWLVCQD